ncbi:hypothetical protein JTB14_029910 [Gonioctena quinquepunctata]|nr:hypothetical protein JTB14_029910 [Gonioctena quinquepunctata]
MICCQVNENEINPNLNQIEQHISTDSDYNLNLTCCDEFENMEENTSIKEIQYLKIIVKHKDFIIRELLEKIKMLQEKKSEQKQSVNNASPPVGPVACPRLDHKDDLDPGYDSSAAKAGVSTRPTPSSNKSRKQTRSLEVGQQQQKITSNQVSAAILEAKNATTMMNLQKVDPLEREQGDSEGWHQVQQKRNADTWWPN